MPEAGCREVSEHTVTSLRRSIESFIGCIEGNDLSRPHGWTIVCLRLTRNERASDGPVSTGTKQGIGLLLIQWPCRSDSRG